MSLKLTQEQSIEGIKKVHGDKYDLSLVEYVSSNSPIKIICKEHGVFDSSHNKLVSAKSGCPRCAPLKRAKSRTNSEADVITKIKEIHGDSLGLSEFTYVSMKSKSTVICKEHGRLEMTPNSLIYGKCGCKYCGVEKSNNAKYLSFDEVLKRAVEIHNGKYDYSKVKDYTETVKKYTIGCPIHGDFEQSFSDHLSGRGCTKCGRDSAADARRNEAEVIYELLRKREVDSGYKIAEGFEYKTVNAKVDVVCEKHGIFTPVLANFLYKETGCPKCATKVSKDEQEVIDFLTPHIEIVAGSRTILKSGKELDIYIPSKNIAIEFNGLYYHSDKFTDKNYHLNKTVECEGLGIRLIHIFEDEWKEKKDIIKKKLLHLIGKPDYKIFARNTTIKEVPTKDVTKFLNENHIQGATGASVKIGLYYRDELVSLMTFGSTRKNLGQSKQDGVFELIRYCTKGGTQVVGGASKLLSHFEKAYKPKFIISYADKRWSDGIMYKTLGFDFEHLSSPNYYYTRGNKRENRFNYRKDVLVKEGFDANKTEREIMTERGFDRIYDCGSLKFTKTYSYANKKH